MLRGAANVWNEVSSLEPVRLRIDFDPEPFPGEPNDDVRQAQAVEYGAAVEFALAPRRDLDVFRLEVPDEIGVTTARLLAWPDVHQPYPVWLDESGGVLVDGEWVTRPGPGKKRYILQYHAVGEKDVREISQGSFDRDSFLWYTDEDLEAAPPAIEPPEGWLPFGVEPKASDIETGRNSE